MKCVIIDDEPLAIDVIESYILKIGGLEIVAKCNNPLEAITLMNKHSVDLVFLDIEMPKMDGLQTLREMMKINPSSRVLVVSALKDPATNLTALKLGARGFLAKPFTEALLREEIIEILGDEND
jgi:DNA-binding NarL/FixJ family response regulator